MTSTVKSRSDVTFVLVFFFALAIIGIVAGGFFVRDYARARASVGWPVVEGVVLSRLEGDAARVRYVYSFAGRSYQSKRERVFSARFTNTSTRDYAPGEAVDVYVNPANPAFAVLEPGGAGLAFVIFSFLSGLCVFVGVGGVIWTFSDGVDPQLIDGQVDDRELRANGSSA